MMKDQLAPLALEVAKMLVPVLAAMLIALIGKGISALSAKTKNEALLHLLDQLKEAANTAVGAAEQVVIDGLQKGVPVPEEKLAEAKAHAMASVKVQLGPQRLSEMRKTMKLDDAGVDRLLSNHIEATISQKKAAASAAGGAK